MNYVYVITIDGIPAAAFATEHLAKRHLIDIGRPPVEETVDIVAVPLIEEPNPWDEVLRKK